MAYQSKNQEKKSYKSTIDQLLEKQTPTADAVAKALATKKEIDEAKQAEKILASLQEFDRFIENEVIKIQHHNKYIKYHRKQLKEILQRKDEYLNSLK